MKDQPKTPSDTPGLNQEKYLRAQASYRHPKSNSTIFENNIFVEFKGRKIYHLETMA